MPLILASSSPRRAELLTQAGYAFAIRVADIDEGVRDGEPPDVYVRRLAVEKAAMVAASAGEEEMVLAADTTVVVDGAILGKPANDADAADMLRQLSGRTHEVMTGVSLRRGTREMGRVERTTVWVSVLTGEDIEWYASTGEGKDKAGGYAIQGLASRFIPRIEGSYTNVVGLPLALVHELIREAGGRALPALHRPLSGAILNASRSRKSL